MTIYDIIILVELGLLGMIMLIAIVAAVVATIDNWLDGIIRKKLKEMIRSV